MTARLQNVLTYIVIFQVNNGGSGNVNSHNTAGHRQEALVGRVFASLSVGAPFETAGTTTPTDITAKLIQVSMVTERTLNTL